MIKAASATTSPSATEDADRDGACYTDPRRAVHLPRDVVLAMRTGGPLALDEG